MNSPQHWNDEQQREIVDVILDLMDQMHDNYPMEADHFDSWDDYKWHMHTHIQHLMTDYPDYALADVVPEVGEELDDLIDYALESCRDIWPEDAWTATKEESDTTKEGTNTTKEPVTHEAIANILTRLRNIPQSPQRTDGWYETRHQMLTASNICKSLGSDHERNTLIYQKSLPWTPIPIRTSVEGAMEWGIRYEPVTQDVYCRRFGTKLEEFGCLPDAEYPFIGASPDGINVDPNSPKYGRLIEIKNAFSREITGVPKPEYADQMQLQMRVTGLPWCDFVETKFLEFDSPQEFYDTALAAATDPAQYAATVAATRGGNGEIGMLMQIMLENGAPDYIYHPAIDDYAVYTKDYVNHWVKTQIAALPAGTLYAGIRFWKLVVFSLLEVNYNPSWFNNNINMFKSVWDRITENRKHPENIVPPPPKNARRTNQEDTTNIPVKHWYKPSSTPTLMIRVVKETDYSADDDTFDDEQLGSEYIPKCLIPLKKRTVTIH